VMTNQLYCHQVLLSEMVGDILRVSSKI